MPSGQGEEGGELSVSEGVGRTSSSFAGGGMDGTVVSEGCVSLVELSLLLQLEETKAAAAANKARKGNIGILSGNSSPDRGFSQILEGSCGLIARFFGEN